jgi:N-acetylneuraminate lyase
MEKIEGLVAAVYTPFDASGALNTSIVSLYAQYLKDCGVRGVFVNGTTGEGLSLTSEERMACAEAWVRQKNDRFTVIIHVGHNSVEESKRLAAHAQSVKADAIGAMAPDFLKTENIEALVAFNATIAASAPELPYYYYHMPAMTGAHYNMIDFLPLAEKSIPNFAGIKFTHEDLMDMKLCLEYSNRKYDILHGRDEILICGLALGARGAIGSTYNYIAPLFTRILESYKRDDLQEADSLQLLAIKIIKVLHAYGGALKSGKYFMQFLGMDLGSPRLPITELSASQVRNLREELENLRFFEYTMPNA